MSLTQRDVILISVGIAGLAAAASTIPVGACASRKQALCLVPAHRLWRDGHRWKGGLPVHTMVTAIICVLTGLVVAACGGAAPQAARHSHPPVTARAPTPAPPAAALSVGRACQRFSAAQQAIAGQVPNGPVTKASLRALTSFGQGLIHLGVLLASDRPAPAPKLAHDLQMAGKATIALTASTPAQAASANAAAMRWLTAAATDCALIRAAGIP